MSGPSHAEPKSTHVALDVGGAQSSDELPLTTEERERGRATSGHDFEQKRPVGRAALTAGAPWRAPKAWAEGEDGDDRSGCQPGANQAAAWRIVMAGDPSDYAKREYVRSLVGAGRTRRGHNRPPMASRAPAGRPRTRRSDTRGSPADGESDQPPGEAPAPGLVWGSSGVGQWRECRGASCWHFSSDDAHRRNRRAETTA
jgi:hypothetical protein